MYPHQIGSNTYHHSVQIVMRYVHYRYNKSCMLTISHRNRDAWRIVSALQHEHVAYTVEGIKVVSGVVNQRHELYAATWQRWCLKLVDFMSIPSSKTLSLVLSISSCGMNYVVACMPQLSWNSAYRLCPSASLHQCRMH